MKRKLKRRLLPILTTILVLMTSISALADGTGKADAVRLPFVLSAPTQVSLSWLHDSNNNPTRMVFAYSKSENFSEWLSRMADPETHDQTVDEYQGRFDYSDLFTGIQVDWAVDDPVNGWHHTEIWDSLGVKLNEQGFETYTPAGATGFWDVIDEGRLSPEITQTMFLYDNISDDFDQPESENYIYWAGKDDTSGHFLGLKEQLKDGQYSIEHDDDGNARLTIDYNQHTFYARARFFAKAYDVRDGVPYYYYFSDWSETAAYGKDAPASEPYTEESLKAPQVSNLKLIAERFNGEPMAAYNLTIPADLQKGLAQVSARGGHIDIEVQMRAKGTQEWKTMQGDWIPASGLMKVKLIGLNPAGMMIPDGSELEFRARYYCEQYEYWDGSYLGEFYSEFSPVLTMKTSRIGNGKSIYETKPSNPDGGQGGGTVKPSKPSEPLPPISSLDTAGAKADQVSEYITSISDEKDPKGTTFGKLFARQKKNATNSITLTWKKPADAVYFIIYGTTCGKGNKYAQLGKISNTTFTARDLPKGTYHKFIISAFDQNDVHIASSNIVHVTTKGGKFCNFKKVTTAAKGDKVILAKKGKRFKLKAKAVPESTKMKCKAHRKMGYESDNPKVATVDKNGKITAKGKGKCTVLVYAHNGVYKKIKVTVSK